jgi:pyridoxamine 5'-phosphate oxidase
MTRDTEALRRQYMDTGFDPRDAARLPMEQFARWFDEARQAGFRSPNAMTLATSGANGRPAARMVLMTHHSAEGFVYFTDERSPKAAATTANPYAALVFHWAVLERQVRIEGSVAPMPDAENEAQWQQMAWGPKMRMWVARQSAIVPDRAELEEALLQLMARYEHEPIPRPPNYRGFRVSPSLVEFWQGRDDWLHDRVRYRLLAAGGWLIERLAP